MNNLFQADSSLHRINKNDSMSSPVPDGTDLWAGKSGIWLIISFCNSLQLWINLGKGNLFRLHVLSLLPPLKEAHYDSWFLLLPFVSLKYIYSVSGCSEFEVIFYACFLSGEFDCCSQFFNYILVSLRSTWSYRIMVYGSLEVNINFVTATFVSI